MNLNQYYLALMYRMFESIRVVIRGIRCKSSCCNSNTVDEPDTEPPTRETSVSVANLPYRLENDKKNSSKNKPISYAITSPLNTPQGTPPTSETGPHSVLALRSETV